MRITVAKGDGIGPEITDAVLRILDAADCGLVYDFIDVGESAYLSGSSSGVPDEAWSTIRRNPVLLKGPVTTPRGGGFKSLNVAIRTTLGLYANVRPCRSHHPFVRTHFPELDVVVVRENEEDLYTGIEHRQTGEVYQCLKLVSVPGSERIIRYAFEYARANGRSSVTCMVKDNIMKLTDGLFSRIFRRVGEEYPEIQQDVQIIDIGAARLATHPYRYDVVVTLNLYGDILSDVVAELTGSVGLAGSANVGTELSMFEAIHGSAPDIAGLGIANPSGLLHAACMMLVHLGLADKAETVENAWSCTLEDGLHTADIFGHEGSVEKVGTEAFADAVIERLGRVPRRLARVDLSRSQGSPVVPAARHRPAVKKQLCGIDVFLDALDIAPEDLAGRLTAASTGILDLRFITNRGVQVWPEGFPETFCTDHWRCRFVALGAHPAAGASNFPPVEATSLLRLLEALHGAGLDVIKTENLYLFDGERGFSAGQGE